MVFDLTLSADISTIGDVNVSAAIVLAVDAESIEFVFLDGCLQIDLLLVRLGCDR